MTQQQITAEFGGCFLQDLGAELFEGENLPSTDICMECQRSCCICDRNTASEISITSEDSLKNRPDMNLDCYLSENDEEPLLVKAIPGNHQHPSQQDDDELAGNICWENWSANYSKDPQSGSKPPHRDSPVKELSEGGGCSNRVQSPVGAPYSRQTFVRPIMLQPANMFDSDLRVFFVRSLQDVRLFAMSETSVKTDVEFHPFMTSQGATTVSAWAAAISPIAASSPYFSEIFTHCMIKGGSVDLCIQTQKQLTVTMINGSTSRDAIIYAGTVLAVLEICRHKY